MDELSRSFDSEQGTIRWDVIGAGPPVVLLHGTPFSSFIWHEVAVALATRFEVYLWDLAGYGVSEQAEGQDVSLAAQARIFAALLDRLAAPWAGEEGRAALYRQIAQNDQRWTDDIQPRYGELDLPVHSIWGADDAWLPVEQAHELHALIPGSSLTVIPDAGHLVPVDVPATVAADLATFLAC